MPKCGRSLYPFARSGGEFCCWQASNNFNSKTRPRTPNSPEVAVLWTFFFFLRTPPVRVEFAPPNRLAIMRSRAAMMSEATSSPILQCRGPCKSEHTTNRTPQRGGIGGSQSTTVLHLKVQRGLPGTRGEPLSLVFKLTAVCQCPNSSPSLALSHWPR